MDTGVPSVEIAGPHRNPCVIITNKYIPLNMSAEETRMLHHQPQRPGCLSRTPVTAITLALGLLAATCARATPPPPTPPNDLCSSVTAVPLAIGASISFSGDNTGATFAGDAVEGSVMGSASLPSVWHAFTLSSCAAVTVSYCGTDPLFGNYWHLLSVDCPSSQVVNPVSSNEELCPNGALSLVFDPLPPGTYYLPVLMDVFNNAVGSYAIEVSAVVCTGGTPPNDLCSSVTPEPLPIGGEIEFIGDNTGATSIEDGEPWTDIGASGLPTVWHAFTLSSCAAVVVDYCGTQPAFGNYWNYLARGCPAQELVGPVLLNYTECTNGGRTLTYDQLEPGTYYVPVLRDPFNDAQGVYHVRVRAYVCTGGTPPNDPCGSVVPESLPIGTTLTFIGDNSGATFAGDGTGTSLIAQSGLPTVWHAFTLNECANLKISYCGTDPSFGNYWNLLALDCPASQTLSASYIVDDECGGGDRTLYYLSVTPGTYYLPVLNDAFNDAQGVYEVHVSALACAGFAPVNDICSNVSALLEPGAPLTFTGNTAGASSINDGAEGSLIAESGLPTVWHAFSLHECANVTVSYCGSTTTYANYWNLLAIGCPASEVVFASGWSDDLCGDGLRVIRYDQLPAGRYQIPVLFDPFNGSQGPYTLLVTATSCDVVTHVPEGNSASWSFTGDAEGNLSIITTEPGFYHIEHIDALGRLVHVMDQQVSAGMPDRISSPALGPGIRLVRVTHAGEQRVLRLVVP